MKSGSSTKSFGDRRSFIGGSDARIIMGDDEEATIRTLTAYRALISSLIQHYRGRVVDAPARRGVRVWLGSSQLQRYTEGLNLFIWHCHRRSAEAHDVYDPWNLENTYALRYRDANEHVARKERQFYVCPAVFPVAD